MRNTSQQLVLLGSGGYVGEHFCRALTREQIPFVSLSRRDTIDVARLSAALREANAWGVINAAGYTGKPNVDACETDRAACLAGNAVLPGIVRDACEQLEIPWGHISSGCIYTGRRSDGGGFTEDDAPNFSFRPNNCSFYSGTKALGEEVLSGASQCYIWRMRIPFEPTANGRNYLQKLLTYQTLLEAENSLSQLEEFVQACLDCLRQRLPFGVYNLTNPGSVWTSEVVELIRAAGLGSKEFRFFASEADFLRIAAKTPRSNCVLDSSKSIAAGLRLTPIRTALEQTLARWQAMPLRTPVG